VVCLTTHFSSFTLCFRFDLLGCVVFVYAGTRNIFDITCRDTALSYICARVKEGINSYFGQVLYRTGLTGWLLFSAVKFLTGLTGLCTDFVFKC
jgi:hypothetical protein